MACENAHRQLDTVNMALFCSKNSAAKTVQNLPKKPPYTRAERTICRDIHNIIRPFFIFADPIFASQGQAGRGNTPPPPTFFREGPKCQLSTDYILIVSQLRLMNSDATNTHTHTFFQLTRFQLSLNGYMHV